MCNIDPHGNLRILDAQQKCLSSVKSPLEKHQIILSSGNFINTVSTGDPNNPPLVLIHGWGTGLAFYAKNIDPLAKIARLHLIDMMGCGASSRPAFPPYKENPEATENYFHEPLREWMARIREYDNIARSKQNRPSSTSQTTTSDAQKNSSKFKIMAHSLGAFLSAKFAILYPELVDSLLLISPVGLPKAPPSIMPPRSAPIKKQLLFFVIMNLWKLHWTPQMLLRVLPEIIGVSLVKWFLSSRLQNLVDAELNNYVSYLYSISIAFPSGENAMNRILKPGAWAMHPLCESFHKLRSPVTFFYGSRDWMDPTHAINASKTIQGHSSVKIINNAGHHLYIDNPDHFNEEIIHSIQEMSDYTSKQQINSDNRHVPPKELISAIP